MGPFFVHSCAVDSSTDALASVGSRSTTEATGRERAACTIVLVARLVVEAGDGRLLREWSLRGFIPLYSMWYNGDRATYVPQYWISIDRCPGIGYFTDMNLQTILHRLLA